MVRFVPVLTLLVLLGPVAAGIWGTFRAAFGHMPAAGMFGPSLDPLRALFDWPGLGASVRLSIGVGLAATLVSLAIACLAVAAWSGRRSFRRMQSALSPLLAVPHAAAAFGFAFLIAPSGWIARLLSPGITGWERPPDWLILNDPAGLALIAGLVVKEVPFLLLMILAALPQADAALRLRQAQSLGYGRITSWAKAVFPAVYAQVRLPVYVVLAYSMSVVDMALILGAKHATAAFGANHALGL